MTVRAYYLDSPDFKPALKLYQAEEPARETWKSALESDSKGARIEDIKSFTIWQEDFNSSSTGTVASAHFHNKFTIVRHDISATWPHQVYSKLKQVIDELQQEWRTDSDTVIDGAREETGGIMALGILDTEYLAIKGIKVYYRTSSGAGIPNLAGFLKMSGPTGLFILQRNRYMCTVDSTQL